MVPIEWSIEAERGLSDIHAYIAEHNPAAADRTIRGILKRADQLARFPQLGPPLAGYEARGLRQLVYGHYRIIYRLDEADNVYIVGVFHGAMDFERYL